MMRNVFYAAGFLVAGALSPMGASAQTQSQEGRFVEGAKYAQASSSYYSRRNSQDRQYRSMQRSTQRAYGANRR